jgi:hypothetical protein
MARENEQPIRLPKISDGDGHRGISGYRGTVEVYDPAKEKARLAKEAAKAAETAEAPDYESMKKDDLIALAEERGIDSSGNKADIIERLNA